MSVSNKLFYSWSNKYQKLKRLRNKMIRNGYTCGPIKKNDRQQTRVEAYYFTYKREQAEDAFKPIPSDPKEYYKK